MTAPQFYHPGRQPDPSKADLEARKSRFHALNDFVRARNAWLISVPGDQEATLECLAFSTVPQDLRRLGYRLTEIAGGERILAGAITERFYTRADGERELLAEGSTKPVPAVFSHAGIVQTRRFSFDIPRRREVWLSNALRPV